MFTRSLIAGAALALLSTTGIASAQNLPAYNLTTQDRVLARQVVAEQGPFLTGKSVYQTKDMTGRGNDRVPIYGMTFKTSDGKTVPGWAVANELSSGNGTTPASEAGPSGN